MPKIVLKVAGLNGRAIEADPQKEIQISYITTEHRFSSTTPDLVVLAIEWGTMVSAQVVGCLLYDLIKRYSSKPPQKLYIERKELTFDQGELKKIIEEHITEEKG
jgi:hypothetical protein